MCYSFVIVVVVRKLKLVEESAAEVCGLHFENTIFVLDVANVASVKDF